MNVPGRARHVVVLGGGVTGLACAHSLTRPLAAAPTVRVTLVEARARLGGNIHTDRVDDFVIDAGPDAWVANKPDASTLAKELGLEDQLVSTIEANRRVYIAWNGELHAMPEGLVLGIPTEMKPFLMTPLLSLEGKLRAGFDLFIPPRRFEGTDDESVGAFIARRLGDEVSDRLVGPLLGGIFAGDAYSISVRAAFASLVDAEAKHGSLIRAMRAQRRAGARTRPAPSAFVSLDGGMGTFIDALETSVRASSNLRTGVSATRVSRLEGRADEARFAVELETGEVLHAHDVVLALPTRISGQLARSVDSDVASHLASLLGYSSTAAVFLAYPREAVQHALDATGFIVPHAPGRTLIAATFVTSKWAHRGPEGKVLFRAFLGGADIEALLQREDDELARIARDELASFVSTEGAPLFARVYRHVRASPQPTVGHHARRAKLEGALSRIPGLYVAASGVDGVGIPDCIKQAKAIARSITADGSSAPP